MWDVYWCPHTHPQIPDRVRNDHRRFLVDLPFILTHLTTSVSPNSGARSYDIDVVAGGLSISILISDPL